MNDNESISEETNTHSEHKENNIVIDIDDLILIEEPATWDLPKEYILVNAQKLEFDTENDPPEILEIAKRYLLKPLASPLTKFLLPSSFPKSSLCTPFIM